MALLRHCVNRGRQSAHAFARCVDHLLILFYDSLGDSPTLSAAGIAVTRHRHPDEYPIRKWTRGVSRSTRNHTKGNVRIWWTHLDSNQGPLACEASALTGLSYASTGATDYRAARATSQESGSCDGRSCAAICVLLMMALLVSSKRTSPTPGASSWADYAK